ncbi:MAG: hypothetical protein HY200_03420 [Nitrospirae bacterium]|nr:hypothetical protein [Nitrospirota bacterium]
MTNATACAAVIAAQAVTAPATLTQAGAVPKVMLTPPANPGVSSVALIVVVVVAAMAPPAMAIIATIVIINIDFSFILNSLLVLVVLFVNKFRINFHPLSMLMIDVLKVRTDKSAPPPFPAVSPAENFFNSFYIPVR